MSTSLVHRVVIVGSGPAGYAAGVYTARASLKPLLLAGETAGGQLMFTTEVENYAGFSKGILGPMLMGEMRAQAERFGTVIRDQFVASIDTSSRPFTIAIQDEPEAIKAEAIILTTGAQSKMLGVAGESEYLGRGVATCAVCDAAFYRDKRVAVVGGGDAAMEDTLALTKFATKVWVLVRGESMRASKIMQDRVLNHEKVEVLYETEVLSVEGDGVKVQAVKLSRGKEKKQEKLLVDGLFLAIGHTPSTTFLQGSGIQLDPKGYVVTGLGLSRMGVELARQRLKPHNLVAYPTMTSVEGIFAAGDNVDFVYRQAMTAAGMGTMAALDVERFLERQAT